ncbi:MAG: ABC transporter substrate-binding protein [Methylobacteriaceae bacterium]|nr:ABC transporter substrate-binding protein [Methylobacteriaceae bacterium]MBV9246796.1 ABC transporter substrate-binding protein [Methylobacteriaceae bacterium]
MYERLLPNLAAVFTRRTIASLGLGAVMSLGVAATIGSTPARAQAPEQTSIEIWAVRDPQEAAVIALAKELDYYKAEGLDVTIKWIVSGTDMASLVASGDINFAGESVTTSAILRDKGIDIRYVMPTANIGGTQCIVLGPNTTLSSPKDLEGKKIGMAAGSGVAIAIRNMAAQYGVDYTKITFVNLQPPDQAPALARGDIDAMAVWQPWALAGMSLGGKLFFTGNKSYIEGSEKPVNWMYLDAGLNVPAAYLAKNPNTVKAVMRALLKAIDYINKNPVEQSAKLLASPLNVPLADLVPIMKQNIYSASIDDNIVKGATELLTYGADPKIGWFSKPYAPKELWDLTLLKELAPDQVKAGGF